ncbi:hypothetical protein MG293_005983 [Ovis ammon polii]|uniref:Uncharacterized protein n=1 Tax=Ovis ammon polii TaxID=230172 RepID=A0AAD4UFT4_OVIAM|nr:hypothetical protein MG293_005983 [Ovis ammon polii]
MSALSSRLWDMPLHHLSNPGSHSMMTYCLHKKSPISYKESRLLQLLGNVLPCVTLPVVLKWSTTQKQGLNPSSTNMADFTVANVALSWASSVHAQPLSGGPPSVPSTDDRPLCAGPERHEAPGCWCEDLQMAHVEKGTERNLHSGHMVYTTALMGVGVGTGVQMGGPQARDTQVWSRQEGEGL